MAITHTKNKNKHTNTLDGIFILIKKKFPIIINTRTNTFIMK